MNNYPANSHKTKVTVEEVVEKKVEPTEQTEPKKVDKVIVGEVVRRKKPLGKRFAETFFGGQDAKSVWSYVAMDVLLPAAKDMIADAVSQGVDRMIFGDNRTPSPRRGNRPTSSNGFVSYNRYSSTSTPPRREEPRNLSRRARASHDFSEIILATRPEAEMVLDRLSDLINQYGSASINDLYDLVGVTGDYTDDKWGWMDIRDATVTRLRNGFLLNLPKTEQLN